MEMISSCGLLRNYWYAACQSSQLGKKHPIKRTILEVPLVLWRNTNASPIAMTDRCPHRNAPLSEGKIIDDQIICPYHGWTFNKAGNCVNIPSEGPKGKKEVKGILKTWLVQEKYGLIWVWMGENEPDKEPFPMPMWDTPHWKHYYMRTRFENNVTDLVENFMDVPHTVFVHKGWFRDKKQLKVPMEVERTEESVLVSYDQPNDSIGFADWLVNPKKLPMVHTDKFYMPNTTRVDYVFGENESGFIITSTCTPIKPFETEVFTLISYKFGWLNPLFRVFLPYYTRQVINQDVWIMKVQGENHQKFPTPQYKSTQADTMHLYIESLREWAEKGGVNPPPKPVTKSCEFWI